MNCLIIPFEPKLVNKLLASKWGSVTTNTKQGCKEVTELCDQFNTKTLVLISPNALLTRVTYLLDICGIHGYRRLVPCSNPNGNVVPTSGECVSPSRQDLVRKSFVPFGEFLIRGLPQEKEKNAWMDMWGVIMA